MKANSIPEYARDMGLDVDVYFNRHLRLYSVRCRQTNRVLGHTQGVVLSYVKFVVQLSGWKKAKRTGIRTTHAFARGTLVDFDCSMSVDHKENMVAYNPFRNPFFYLKQVSVGTPCNSALHAYLQVSDGKACVAVDAPNAIIEKKSETYR